MDEHPQRTIAAALEALRKEERSTPEDPAILCVHPSYVVADMPIPDGPPSWCGTTMPPPFSARRVQHDVSERVCRVLQTLLLRSTAGVGGKVPGRAAPGGRALSIVACSSRGSATTALAAIPIAIGVVRDFLLSSACAGPSHLATDSIARRPTSAPPLGSVPLRVAAALSYADAALSVVALLGRPFVGCSLTVGARALPAARAEEEAPRIEEPLLMLHVAYSPLCAYQSSRTSPSGPSTRSASASSAWYATHPCLAQLINMPLSCLQELLSLHRHRSMEEDDGDVGRTAAVVQQAAAEVMRELQTRYAPLAFPRDSTPSRALEWDTFMKRCVEPLGRCLESSCSGSDSFPSLGSVNSGRGGGGGGGARALLRALMTMLLTQELEFEASPSSAVPPLLMPASPHSYNIMVVLHALVRRRPDVLSDTFLDDVLTQRHARGDPAPVPRVFVDVFGDEAPSDDESWLMSREGWPFPTNNDEVEPMAFLFRCAAVTLTRVLCTSPAPAVARQPSRLVATNAIEGLLVLVADAAVAATNAALQDIIEPTFGNDDRKQSADHQQRCRRRQSFPNTDRLHVVLVCCDGAPVAQQNRVFAACGGGGGKEEVAVHHHHNVPPRGVFSKHLGSELDVGNPPRREQQRCSSTTLLQNIAGDMSTAFALRTLQQHFVGCSDDEDEAPDSPRFSLELLQDLCSSIVPTPSIRAKQQIDNPEARARPTATVYHKTSIIAELSDLAARLHHSQHLPIEVTSTAVVDARRSDGRSSAHDQTATEVAEAASALLDKRRGFGMHKMCKGNTGGVVTAVVTPATTAWGAEQQELCVQLPHAWGSDGGPHTWYNVSTGIPLCPMPLCPNLAISPSQGTTDAVRRSNSRLSHEDASRISAGYSQHSLLDALNPTLRGRLFQRLDGGDHESGQQEHPQVQRWREHVAQSRVLHSRRVDACVRLVMRDAQQLFSPVLCGEPVTHLYLSITSGGAPGVVDLEQLRWCLGPYLLRQSAKEERLPRFAHGSGRDDGNTTEGRTPGRFVASTLATSFCSEFFPLVANAPNIAMLRSQLTDKSTTTSTSMGNTQKPKKKLQGSGGEAEKDHRRIEDVVFLKELCVALAFPPGSFMVQCDDNDADAFDGNDATRVLFTAIGVHHVDALRSSVRAIVEQHDSPEPEAFKEPQHDLDVQQQQARDVSKTRLRRGEDRPEGAHDSKKKSAPRVKPRCAVDATAQVGIERYKDPLSLQFTPHKRFVDSSTVRMLSRSGDDEDLLGFQYHVSRAAQAAAAEELEKRAAMDAALRDDTQPPWRRTLLVPLAEQVRLTAHTTKRCANRVFQQQDTNNNRLLNEPRGVVEGVALPAASMTERRSGQATTVGAQRTRPASSTQRNETKEMTGHSSAAEVVKGKGPSRRPPTASSRGPRNNTVVGHLASSVSMATISSIRSSSTAGRDTLRRSSTAAPSAPHNNASAQEEATTKAVSNEVTSSLHPQKRCSVQQKQLPRTPAASRSFGVSEFKAMLQADCF